MQDKYSNCIKFNNVMYLLFVVYIIRIFRTAIFDCSRTPPAVCKQLMWNSRLLWGTRWGVSLGVDRRRIAAPEGSTTWIPSLTPPYLWQERWLQYLASSTADVAAKRHHGKEDQKQIAAHNTHSVVLFPLCGNIVLCSGTSQMSSATSLLCLWLNKPFHS